MPMIIQDPGSDNPGDHIMAMSRDGGIAWIMIGNIEVCLTVMAGKLSIETSTSTEWCSGDYVEIDGTSMTMEMTVCMDTFPST